MKTNINELNKEMRLNRLNLNDYMKFKDKINELGMSLNLTMKKNKVQKKQVKTLYESLKIPENLKTLFLSNLYIYDDVNFVNLVQEAKSFGCRPEDYSKYLKLNHNIDENIYRLKLNEMDTYSNFYSKTYISDKVKIIVRETKEKIKPLSNIEYLYEEEKTKEYSKEIA